jgi:hypothetical protein
VLYLRLSLDMDRIKRWTIRIRGWLSPLLLVSCTLVSAAGAQSPRVTPAGVDSLRTAVGFKVRMKDVASAKWRVGTLRSVNDETLILRGRGDTAIATQSLVAAQRSTGHARFNPTVVGFVIGMVAGGATGVAIGNAQRSANEPNGTQRSVGLALGCAIGAGLGAVVGAALAPEHWREIKLR